MVHYNVQCSEHSSTAQDSVQNIPPMPRAVERTFLTLPREVVRTNDDWHIFFSCTTSLGSG